MNVFNNNDSDRRAKPDHMIYFLFAMFALTASCHSKSRGISPTIGPLEFVLGCQMEYPHDCQK